MHFWCMFLTNADVRGLASAEGAIEEIFGDFGWKKYVKTTSTKIPLKVH